MTTKTAVAVTTPRAAGLRQPAEWDVHEAVWLAWPSHADLWGDALGAVRSAFTAFASAIADVDPATGRPRGERLEVLVPDAANEALAKSALAGLGARFHRDPVRRHLAARHGADLPRGRAGARRDACRFAFNGWGGKYVLAHDDGVSPAHRGARRGCRPSASPWVLEGGSVEVDGEGTCLTTRQCLLNPNRNPAMTQEAIEARPRDALGVDDGPLARATGLRNDHTDGHVDTLARFVRAGRRRLHEGRRERRPEPRRLSAASRAISRACVTPRGRRARGR